MARFLILLQETFCNLFNRTELLHYAKVIEYALTALLLLVVEIYLNDTCICLKLEKFQVSIIVFIFALLFNQ